VGAFLGGAASSRPDLDPTRMVSAIEPVVLLHGDADTAVPLRQSQAYAVAHPDSVLTVLPGAGHFGVIDPASAVWSAVVAAVRGVARHETVGGTSGAT
jgi:pimeloyl-ACP methyl ester carboxylesterase